MYVQVNIGRNIGGEPMDAGLWDRFIGAVSRALMTNTDGPNRVLETHKGSGTWDGEEESAHLSIIGADAVYMRSLKDALKDIRVLYMQDHVALIVSQSELV